MLDNVSISECSEGILYDENTVIATAVANVNVIISSFFKMERIKFKRMYYSENLLNSYYNIFVFLVFNLQSYSGIFLFIRIISG